MIIYKDILSGDEIISDSWKLIDVPGGVLWECDCKKYAKGTDTYQLEGANPSAEEGGDDYSGEGGGAGEMVHDIEESFRLNWLKPDESGNDLKPSKDAFKSHLKSYVKKVNNKLKEQGASEETIKEFQAGAPAAVKKLLANYDNYDVLLGSSMHPDGMYVLIDFREDGVTPYATIWKHGLEGMKV
ncbi:hypothetical protein RJZ56_000231 [Blastomyces dermatitidis]|uniref:Translationally-controlled tumor protein homolog n=3 Tax=Blastomyces TaxID=229219 RepID=A0A179UVY1_BLAGS|nr:translationally-controlled tumor protein [Blastomyces gilchristii SLH14081]XP_045276475.1 translationally-controlled tumor protein [Blastomyces dermatitidis ER-3]EGE85754.1 translationally-controlled tumor protein [Blastomyces dermatitidis ATCC 18188]EQL34812.1 translationally-controlled tumor protein [Blastomyces dermatitidis ATCC 26199]EEQ89585.1 translationally-controlled tumor protein [Blastomyces dermatitidis ER-3]OAT12256.1 translationally-controlled tumor protein [Blastomyces gilchri